MTMRSTSYVVGRGFAGLRRADTVCKIKVTDIPFSVVVALIDATWCETFLEGANLSYRVFPQFLERDDPVLMHLVARLLGMQDAGGDDAPEAQALQETILRHLLVTCLPEHTPIAALSTPRLTRVIDYIVAHLPETLDLDDLAAVAGTSRFEFARAFAKAKGVPPHRYIMLRRLQTALDRIREDDGPLADIALASGFCDQSHMTRWMQREIGMSPRRFRAERAVVPKEGRD